ncbi:MAG TPA: Fe-S-containing hydro-lyase [Dehalococcoidales bacterium]|nr:Fe-S-containing hydro-lyase [Dehalococcoidales bacterium]
METLQITSPIDAKTIEELTVGTQVLISGVVYTARDAAHHRLTQSLDKGERLPVNLRGQTIYYVGPTPARPGQVIGSAGPTTSSRMDMYTPRLIAAGIRAMIGKGSRSPAVRESIQKHKAIYFVAIGGTGALLAQCIKRAEVVAYEDLGTEAIRKLTVENFPAIVANDIYGEDIFEQGKAKYRREKQQ